VRQGDVERIALKLKELDVPVAIKPPLALFIAEEADSDLPAVGDDGLLWKERHAGGRTLLQVREIQLVGGTLLAVGGLILLSAAIDHHPFPLDVILGSITRALLFPLLACFAMGVAFRAAGSVVREKQAHTLDLLLQLPVDRAQILSAKWLGALRKGQPWALLLLADLAVGVIVGGFSPVDVLLLLAVSISLVLLLCSVGLFISVVVQTRLQANVIMAVVLVAIVAAFGTIGTRLSHEEPALGAFGQPRSLTLSIEFVLAALVAAFTMALARAHAWMAAKAMFERTGR
jgi:hypothetical protein